MNSSTASAPASRGAGGPWSGAARSASPRRCRRRRPPTGRSGMRGRGGGPRAAPPGPSGRCWRRRRRGPAPPQQLVEAVLAARGRPVALDDELVSGLRARRAQGVPPAGLALPGLPPVQRPGDDAHPPGAACEQVLVASRPMARLSMPIDGGGRRPVMPPTRTSGTGKSGARSRRPGPVVADLGDGPDDAVHLAPGEAASRARRRPSRVGG